MPLLQLGAVCYDEKASSVIGQRSVLATAIREDVREAILDATERLLARYGYRKMTVEDIAREVGIGKGSIYLHFSSKEEVVLSHVDRIVQRLKERLSDNGERAEVRDKVARA
jgi:AcrR family transcriptional regulator